MSASRKVTDQLLALRISLQVTLDPTVLRIEQFSAAAAARSRGKRMRVARPSVLLFLLDRRGTGLNAYNKVRSTGMRK